MVPLTRRGVLTAAGTLGVAAVTGCAGRTTSPSASPSAGTSASTSDCTATDPPRPTDAAASPKAYPERPSQLTRDTVRSYVSAYERAYQYNTALADDPQKIGRLNELEIHLSETTVEADDPRFTVSVSGSRYYRISTPDSSDTPTVTPLPIGHGPFSASYVAAPESLRREGVIVECW